MSSLLFTKQFALEMERRLRVCREEMQTTDLLTLLLGRVLQIQEDKETGVEIEEEVERIARVACSFLSAGAEVRWAALEIIRYLPMRTEREVAHVLALAQDTQDEALQRACAEAISQARPATDKARRALEQAREFPVAVVRVAVEEWLEKRSG